MVKAAWIHSAAQSHWNLNVFSWANAFQWATVLVVPHSTVQTGWLLRSKAELSFSLGDLQRSVFLLVKKHSKWAS